MIRFLLLVGLACASLGESTSNGQEKPKPTKVSGKINWVYDYAQGQNLSLETGKPMFVVIRCER